MAAPSLEAVLDHLGVRLTPTTTVAAPPSGMACLGRLEAWPGGLGDAPVDPGALIWRIEDGPGRFDAWELERWQLDAPPGQHWLFSERRLADDLPPPGTADERTVIWRRDDLARWLGAAVLAGDLAVVPPQDDGDGLAPTADADRNGHSTSQRSRGEAAYPPLIDLKAWFVEQGLESRPARPVLLELRQWRVDGELVAPGGEREATAWTVLDDPWRDSLALLPADLRPLEAIPQLERLELAAGHAEASVRAALPGLCDVRREERHEGIAGGFGGVLETWRIDHAQASLAAERAWIPGWQVLLPSGEAIIVHGLDGSRVRPLAA